MSLETIDDECLRTGRLVLTLCRMADADAIAVLANDRHIAEMTTRLPHPYSIDDAKTFLASSASRNAFALHALDGSGVIGLASLEPQENTPRTSVLGYWIGRPFWARGHATEATQALVDFAFERQDAACVEARCRVVNGASRRVLQKCGFQYAGTGMVDSLVAGRVASETYRMDRRCWQSLKDWGGR